MASESCRGGRKLWFTGKGVTTVEMKGMSSSIKVLASNVLHVRQRGKGCGVLNVVGEVTMGQSCSASDFGREGTEDVLCCAYVHVHMSTLPFRHCDVVFYLSYFHTVHAFRHCTCCPFPSFPVHPCPFPCRPVELFSSADVDSKDSQLDHRAENSF